jgi:hypothetical protein
MSLYEQFMLDTALSNRNIVITFCAALIIVLSWASLDWLPEKWQSTARNIYLAWWLIIFLLFYFVKFE